MDFKTWKTQNSNLDNSKNEKMSNESFGKPKSTAQKLKNKSVDDVNPADREAIENKINTYKDKSEDELTQELLATASKLKSDGKLSKKDVDEFYETAKGFLNDEQLSKLQSLIKMLGV